MRKYMKKIGRQTAGAGGEGGIAGDAADAAEVHRRQRGTGVEAVPAEPEEESADDADDQIVRQHGAAAVALELATQPGPKHDAAGQAIHPPIE
jgi:hypothetical protein